MVTKNLQAITEINFNEKQRFNSTVSWTLRIRVPEIILKQLVYVKLPISMLKLFLIQSFCNVSNNETKSHFLTSSCYIIYTTAKNKDQDLCLKTEMHNANLQALTCIRITRKACSNRLLGLTSFRCWVVPKNLYF